MNQEILINISPEETRVALLDQGVLRELFLERTGDKGVVGNIYKGRVAKVLPGMQAAFVDIGLGKAAFLYAGDVHHERQDYAAFFDRQKGDGENGLPHDPPEPPPLPSIDDLLSEGQEIMVQVAKGPLGAKGARITSLITLPGRYLVYMPALDHVGISRRIEEEEERERLKSLVEEIREPGEGYIVRTASEGIDREQLAADMRYLKKMWSDIQEKSQGAPPSSLLYADLDLVLRSLRDLACDSMEKIRIDDLETFKSAQRFVQAFMPRFETIMELYAGKRPLFDLYGVEEEIAKALKRKVWLKSGGSLVFDQTEALTAIDVNTGRYVGKRNLEETILKINLEAAREIARQLRVRNIGGIIVVDFIDMTDLGNREKLYNAFTNDLASDRVKTNVLKVSELGLVQMTRKRTRESLGRLLYEPCGACSGTGAMKTVRTVAYEIFRETVREAREFPSASKKLMVMAAPEVIDLLVSEESEGVATLSANLGKDVVLRADSAFHREKFEIVQL